MGTSPKKRTIPSTMNALSPLVPLAAAALASFVTAQDGGWTAKAGSGLQYAGGDRFALSLLNQLQVTYTYLADESAVDTSNFQVLRARTTLSGHVFRKELLYFVQLEALDAGSNSNLKEGHATWNFVHGDESTVGLRVGQGKTLFGLESTGSIAGLAFVYRSTAAREFADKYNRGAWLNGKHLDSTLRWTLAAVNSPTLGEEADNVDDELGYVANLHFDPLGDFFGGKQTAEAWRQGDFRTGERPLVGTIGAGVAFDNTTVAGIERETQVLNLNTAWNWQGLQLLAEWFDRSIDPAAGADLDSDGFAVAATYVLQPAAEAALRWGFGARYSTVDLSDAGGVEQTDVSLVANAFYHAHAAKTQLELTQRSYDGTGSSDDTDYVITLAFQLLF
jgi:hypothetical protein